MSQASTAASLEPRGGYGMRCTPATIVIGHDGLVPEHAFRQVDGLGLRALAIADRRAIHVVARQP